MRPSSYYALSDRAGKGNPIDGYLAGVDPAVAPAIGGQNQAVAGKPARPSQTVSITTVNGPKDLGRGGYIWKVWFNLASAAGNAGWVIQEITANLGPTKSAKAYHYWEGWQVEKGKATTVWQDKKLDDNDDQYSSPAEATGTKGTNSVAGRVKFYEGDLPADFKKNNPSTIAGILDSSTTAPPYWDATGTTHTITATWDDTVTPSQSTVNAVAGSTTLKGTK